MATATKTLQYKIGMDIGELRRNAETAGTATRAFKRELDELERKQREHRRSLDELGKGMAGFGLAVATGLGLAAKAAIDWESAFTGVRKTVDGSDQEIAALEGELRQLARTLPATHAEIAGVAEAAGQLGIKRQDIAKFTKTMVDLGATTNLAADEAATSLAKISNIMGTSAKDVDRLGSTLVALGNDGASTEKDIVEMALRIAGAGKQLRLSESQVLGFASALSSMGILAEGGGSSISTTMVTISKAVTSGGQKLEAFAAVAGMTGDEFKQSFQRDAGAAIVQFIVGLGKMQKSGGDVFGTLANLDLKSAEVRDTLLRAAGGSDLFTKSLRVGSSAWEKNTALTDEASKRYGTAASRMRVAWNQIQDALIDVGQAVVPVVAGATGGIADMVRGFQKLPGPVKDVVTWVGLAAGGIALFGGAALIAVPKILAFRASMQTMIATGGAVSGVLGRFGLAMVGPWGAALAAGATLLGIFSASQGKAKSATADFTYELDRQAGALSGNSIEALHKMLAEAKIWGGVLDDTGPKISDIINDVGLSYDDLIDYITGAGDAQEEFRKRLEDFNSGSPALLQFLDNERKKYQEQTAEQKAATQSSERYAAQSNKTADSQRNLGQQVGMTEEQVKQSAEALGQLIQALDDTNRRTLNARSAEREFVASIAETRTAVEAAAEARVQAAERVESAERDVASAQRSAKESQVAYTRAQQDARDAQVALTRAREQEVERLEDLNRAVSGAALDEEAGVLSLERAQERLAEARQKGATGLDLREAELGVRQAELALADTRDRYGDLRQEADAANRAGVEGSDAVISAQRGVADSALAVQQAQQGVADAALAVRDALKEVARANKELNLLGNARSLDTNTEAGRRNAEMLDKIAENANNLAEAAAREAEKTGGAAAAAAALASSLKASRPALVDTAIMFGMTRDEAEKYADSVLAVPGAASTLISTPGSRESQAELQRVRDKVYGIPPDRKVNVGVLSQAAITELERIGVKVERLPNGTVNVLAQTAGAYQELDRLIQTYQNRQLNIYVTPQETYYQGQGGRYYAAQGGILSFASGGMHEDHRPQIARASKGTVRMWAEPETGRESYIPWAQDRRGAATGVLRATASGFGYDLMPQGVAAASMPSGGSSGSSGGVVGVRWEVTGGGQSEFDKFMLGWIRRYVRVSGGGSVQTMFGQRA